MREPEVIVRETIDDMLENYKQCRNMRERQTTMKETLTFINGLNPYLKGYAHRYYFKMMRDGNE